MEEISSVRVEICFFREQMWGAPYKHLRKQINLNGVACVGDLIDIDMNIAKEFHIVS